MRALIYGLITWMGFAVICAADVTRRDGAVRLDINLSGSLQNPVFSPDGKMILFTRFRQGYNRGPSDLFIYNFATRKVRKLVADGSSNVNLPGSSWNAHTGFIVFSSDRGAHDEIFYIASSGALGSETQMTDRLDLQVFEPSYSPDGKWVVFESHRIDVEEGVITKARSDGRGGYVNLTRLSEIIKQPNWAPKGNRILYQKQGAGGWAIWVMDTNGNRNRQVTPPNISATDAVFTPGGARIVFSGETRNLRHANLFGLALSGGGISQLTHYNGYDGAPSVSPNGAQIVFESSGGGPDRGKGTRLWMITP